MVDWKAASMVAMRVVVKVDSKAVKRVVRKGSLTALPMVSGLED